MTLFVYFAGAATTITGTLEISLAQGEERTLTTGEVGWSETNIFLNVRNDLPEAGSLRVEIG